ncbi:hypothetical protein [Spirosoma luteolum]
MKNILFFWGLVVLTSTKPCYSQARFTDATRYVIVNQNTGFIESVWTHPDQKHSSSIRAYNYFFNQPVKSSNGTETSNRYLFAAFILPAEDRVHPDWVLVDRSQVERNVLSAYAFENELIHWVEDAKTHPYKPVTVSHIRIVTVQNGNYYMFTNPQLNQCWQLIDSPVKNPDEARPYSLNIGADPFSEELVDAHKKQVILEMGRATNTRFPLGGENVFADYVFLRKKDASRKLFTFWLKPAVVYDGPGYGSGINDFLYSPCAGIIGGNFKAYSTGMQDIFEKIKTNPFTRKPFLGGYYQASMINNVPSDDYLTRCL